MPRKRPMRTFFKCVFLIIVLTVIYNFQNIQLHLRIFVEKGSLSVNKVHLQVSKRITTAFLDQISREKTFKQQDNVCPAFTINNVSESYDYSLNRCRPRKVTSADCNKALRKYGKPPRDHSCPKDDIHQPSLELCFFAESSRRTSKASQVKLKCNFSLCNHTPIRIGVLQPKYGLIVRTDLWYIANNQADIDIIVRRITEDNDENNHVFCIISCGKGKHFIRQALILPSYVKVKKSNLVNSSPKINLNILVLDSVSRQHFYRQLPETVSQLTDINKKTAKVLDFEMLNSLAPRTFPNMRALFSGIVDVDSDDETHTYGLDSLFGRYSNLGYQTTLQEDSCWYDTWGALITDNKHNMNKLSNVDDYGDRWQEIQRKLRRLPIDSYGLTHFSCEVFTQYGKSNQFNEPPKVCFNGHHLSSYFLNYTYDFLKQVETTNFAYPSFIYTHLNAGHEMTGKRIAYTDLFLSDFIKKSATLQNTLTIILSDHGPKTSKFSQEYLAGRYEISQGLMFMILPRNVQRFLGKRNIQSLKTNQHRLITLVDVFHMLMTLHSKKPSGLLEEISSERGCDQIPIYSFMVCLCEGWSEFLPDFHPEVHWLAEFALGYLNNKITHSVEKSSSENIAYENCERLVGKRFNKIRRRLNREGKVVYTFDIIVSKYRDEEIFEVVVTVPNKSTYTKAVITRWRRVSIFQHFSKCSDPYVNIQLCICRKESTNEANPGRDLSRLLASQSFRTETKVKFLDSQCLALLVRWREKIFKSYEIANICLDRIYNVTFNLDSHLISNFKTSHTVPRNITTYPWFIYFITSIPLLDSLVDSTVTEKVSFTVILASST